jgi:hypothetical protein
LETGRPPAATLPVHSAHRTIFRCHSGKLSGKAGLLSGPVGWDDLDASPPPDRPIRSASVSGGNDLVARPHVHDFGLREAAFHEFFVRQYGGLVSFRHVVPRATDGERTEGVLAARRYYRALPEPLKTQASALSRNGSPRLPAERAELHWTYVSGTERGRRNPGLNTLARLAVALNMTVSALLAGVEYKPPSAVPSK